MKLQKIGTRDFFLFSCLIIVHPTCKLASHW